MAFTDIEEFHDGEETCGTFVADFQNFVPAVCRFTTENASSLVKKGPHLVSCFTLDAGDGTKLDAIVVNPFDGDKKPKFLESATQASVGALYFQKPGPPWNSATMCEIHINGAQVTMTLFAHADEIVGVYLGPVIGLTEDGVRVANMDFGLPAFERVTCFVRHPQPRA